MSRFELLSIDFYINLKLTNNYLTYPILLDIFISYNAIIILNT